MTQLAERTVREVALEGPAATRVLESFGIDYCCGGNQPLAFACEKRQVSLKDVLSALELAYASAAQEKPAKDFRAWPMNQLLDYILETHHQYTREALVRLRPMAAKVASRHGESHPELLAVEQCFRELADELDVHLLKEECVLFPHLRRMEAEGLATKAPLFGTVQNPIEFMLTEHESAGDHLAELRQLTHGYAIPSDACATFHALLQGLQELERDLHQHIHLENNIVFPRAIEMEQAVNGRHHA